MNSYLPITALLATLCAPGCTDEEETRTLEERCTDQRYGMVKAKIVSVPTEAPVTSELVVHGITESPPDLLVLEVQLGARRPSTQIEAYSVRGTPGTHGFITWTAKLPLPILLEPNNGPGGVEIEAVPVTACGLADLGHATSKPFDVAMPPAPAD